MPGYCPILYLGCTVGSMCVDCFISMSWADFVVGFWAITYSIYIVKFIQWVDLSEQKI